MSEKISILLSVYKPNPEFLKKQLFSLNEQSYPDVNLIVWNDCPDTPLDESLFAECITAFEYKLYDQKINLGYAKAFEKLVTLADGEYICFCDQDDIWEKDKIKDCISALKEQNGTVAVCDRSLIDENDNIYCESVKKSSKSACETWNTGDDITAKTLFFCHAPGMSMHAKREDVLAYLPIPKGVAHDRWLMTVLSAKGKAVYVNEPLIRYRRYGQNASGVLKGINTKKDYREKRCNNTVLIESFEKHFPNHEKLAVIKSCNKARMNGNLFGIFKNRKTIPDLYVYECLLALCPNFVFTKLKDKIGK